MSADEGKAFTGYTRRKTTRRSVRNADILSRYLISAGGVGTILAVLGVCLFLLWVVVPLFQSAYITEPERVPFSLEGERAPLKIAIDEYQAMGWMLLGDGTFTTFRVDNGEVLNTANPFEGKTITCSAFTSDNQAGAVGFADGSVSLLELHSETRFLPLEEVPDRIREELAELPLGAPATYQGGVVQKTPEAQYRLRLVSLEMKAAKQVAEAPIRLIDLVLLSRGPLVCGLSEDQGNYGFHLLSGREKEDFMTGEKTVKFSKVQDLPFEPLSAAAPAFLKISGTGADLFLGWKDGWLLRLQRQGSKETFIAEKGRLTPEGTDLTAAGFILGRSTLVFGDTHGRVGGGFLVRAEQLESQGLFQASRPEDRARSAFAVAKELETEGPALLCLAPSARSRLLLCGYSDGTIRLYNPTSETCIATLAAANSAPITHLAFSPKENGLLGLAGGSLFHCDLDPFYPEVDAASLFLPVWYEGYPEPMHMWQSSSGTDDFEPKLGLMPLIFGTLKATLYAMLFGGPLALLAALFSSEFLHPRAKSVIKPTIEFMASLPSVVLGFLAALVFAPFVEQSVPAMLLLFATVPFAFLFLAHIWQLIPGEITRRLASWKPAFLIIPMALGVGAAWLLGPWVESLFFAGDIQSWLSWEPGRGSAEGLARATGGWLILLFPLCAIGVFWGGYRASGPWVRRAEDRLGRSALAWVELLRFSLITVGVLGLTLALAALFDGLGLDLRNEWLVMGIDCSPVDLYVQRNALIVGFVMGFAVIPIIYTLADDALAAVPDHLRSASLGAGATTWQTATRIIVPTAMSGLFSSLMIGMGRAVGETMIVLMALGNTAIMDWNLFNGARTLSANIAVELPEAVRNSSHYRTLFLAALVLFAMTFVVNTIAEMVRLAFRKRSVQL